MATAVAPASTGLATGLSHQRKIDRCQNGVLWATLWNGNSSTTHAFEFWYSTNNGATWTEDTAGRLGFAGTGATYDPSASFFIDLDDTAHLVYKDRHNGFIYYRYGVPNAGRTAWTWTPATQINTVATYRDPDVAAFRTPGSSPTTWDVVITCADNATSTWHYERIRIANNGAITANNYDGLTAVNGMGQIVNTGSGTAFSPTIDFHHTGDGKTVKDGLAHLYLGSIWSSTASGTRMCRVTFASGAWTFGAQRVFDSTRYVNDSPVQWATGFFDGTRYNLVTWLSATFGANDLVLHQRDAADTASTSTVLLTNPAAAERLASGSATYDTDGNVWIFGRNEDGVAGTHPLVYRKWTRSGSSLSAETVIDPGVGTTPHIASKRGSSTGRIEVLYTDNATTPWGVTYEAVLLNQPPNAPTNLSPTGNVTIDRTVAQRFSWVFSDPNAGDSQSKYDLQYRVVGAGTWTTVTGTTPNQFHDFAAATFAAGDYEWQVRTYDAGGVVGPWSASSFFKAGTPPTAPTITSPTNGSTISQSTGSVAWSYPSQQAYQARKVADSAGNPDTATVYYDSGVVESTTARTQALTFPVNNRWEHIQVRIRDGGLWSTWASVRVNVAYTPPGVPTVVAAGNDSLGYISVAITNPAPGAGEPTVTQNYLYRREDASGDGIRIKTGIAASGTYNDHAVATGVVYQYKAVAVGSNGTTRDGAWTA